jgi:hypothetical protein
MAVIEEVNKGGFIANGTSGIKEVIVDIANGAQNSETYQPNAYETLVGIVIPVAHTRLTLKLQGSLDNSNWFDVRFIDLLTGATALVQVPTATTTGIYKVPPSVTDGIPFLRLVSVEGTEGALRSPVMLFVDYRSK